VLSGQDKLSSALIQTLAYADIFDYPLTLEEIAKFLVGESEVEREVVLNALRKIIADPSAGRSTLRDEPSVLGSKSSGQVSKPIYTEGEFYFLRGRKEIVELRKRRRGWSEKKGEIARRTVNGLKIIPMIKMIGITGALAMGNCQENDDIDLLIITGANCLWLTRLLIILLSPFLGIKRRKPKEKNVKDKICFNLFLEENHLKIEPENLFLAHEILQMKPIYNKDKTHERFLWENQWIKKFLPNAINNLTREQSNKAETASLFHGFIDIFEKLAFKLQYFYMKPKKTNERVSFHQAFFHPKDLSDKVQKEFERRIKSLVF